MRFYSALMAFWAGPLWRMLPLHICSLSFKVSAAEAELSISLRTEVKRERSASQRKVHVKERGFVWERGVEEWLESNPQRKGRWRCFHHLLYVDTDDLRRSREMDHSLRKYWNWKENVLLLYETTEYVKRQKCEIKIVLKFTTNTDGQQNLLCSIYNRLIRDDYSPTQISPADLNSHTIIMHE